MSSEWKPTRVEAKSLADGIAYLPLPENKDIPDDGVTILWQMMIMPTMAFKSEEAVRDFTEKNENFGYRVYAVDVAACPELELFQTSNPDAMVVHGTIPKAAMTLQETPAPAFGR